MDSTLPLYDFVRRGASIYTARIEKVDTATSSPGQQTVALQMHILETLWGEAGKPLRRAEFTRPESLTAQLKFPHPLWGRIDVREGAHLLLVTDALTEAPADPIYVDEIGDFTDPVLTSISAILQQERPEQDLGERKARYLWYVADGPIVPRLFGAEALAKDTSLRDIDQLEQVAVIMATVFLSDDSPYVRINIATWMWDEVYPRTNALGQTAIINATINALNDHSEDIRRFSADQLLRTDPAVLSQPGVVASGEAIQRLQDELAQQTSPEARDLLQRLITALRR